jgi:hypothetical protein
LAAMDSQIRRLRSSLIQANMYNEVRVYWQKHN